MRNLGMLLLVLCCVPLGCSTTVPPEAIVANTLQAQALATVQADRTYVIDGYEKMLRESYEKSLDLAIELEISEAQRPEVDSTDSQPTGRFILAKDDVLRIMKLKDDTRAGFLGKMAIMRKAVEEDDNLTAAQKITEISGRWLKASAADAAEFQNHVDQLLSVATKAVKK